MLDNLNWISFNPQFKIAKVSVSAWKWLLIVPFLRMCNFITMTTRVPSDDNNTSSNDNNNGCIYFFKQGAGEIKHSCKLWSTVGFIYFYYFIFWGTKEDKTTSNTKKRQWKKPIMKVVKAKPTHGCDKMIKL